MRIAECICADYKNNLTEIGAVLRIWSSQYGVQVISWAPEIFPSKPFSIKGQFGPILTIKKLNLDTEELSFIEKVKNWNYSLGDLELF